MIEKRHHIRLDTDTEDRHLPPGHSRFVLNCNVGSSESSNMGAIENVPGNQLVAFDLPPGENKCIGSYEERTSDSIIYFVYNSAQDHLILQFFLQEMKIIELMRSPVLNFQPDQLISSIDFEDNLLYWTDGYNPQRKINIHKARPNKNLLTHLHFQYNPAPLTAYTLVIKDEGGFTLENSIVFTVPGPDPATIKELVQNITDGINSLGNSPQLFEATNKGTYVELLMNQPGYFDISFSATAPFKAYAVYENMYQRPIKPSFIDLLKYPPNYPPKVSIANNPAYQQVNDTDKRLFEFRARYIYDDHEKSTLGPVSKLPGGEFPFCQIKSQVLEVDYADERLLDVAELCIIRAVDLFVRSGIRSGDATNNNITNNGANNIWKKIDTIDRAEILGTGGRLIFLNNEEYTAVGTKESDKPFDALPLLSNTLALMSNYCFLDAKLEGYDTLPTDVLLSVKVNNSVPFQGLTDRGMFLRRPGFYRWGLVYFDRGNRSATVCTDPTMHLAIPGYSEDLNTIPYVEPGSPGKRHGTVEVNWKIRHLPPVWATHYGWVRTKDSVQKDYLTSQVSLVTYLEADRTTVTTHGSGARYIRIQFDGWVTFNENNPDAGHGWSFNQGDRMRLLRDENDNWFSDIKVAEVVEKLFGETFIITHEPGFPELKPGAMVQFFSPGKEVEHAIYYEIGEFYEIGNPHQADRYHKGQFLNQDPSDPINIPATGTFIEGDNHRIIGRDWGSVPQLIIDSPRADQRYRSRKNSYNLGRVNVYSPDIGQAKRGHTVRFSNKRFAGTNVNGYSSYDAIDARDFQKNYGDIQKLFRVDNVLLSLHTREAVSLYINEKVYRDASGQTTVAISDQVIGYDNELDGQFGTENPESVLVHQSLAFWFCTNKGVFVQYSKSGLDPVSKYFMKTYFHRKGEGIKQYGGNVLTTFDEFHRKVLVAFSKIAYLDDSGPEPEEVILNEAETLAYDIDLNSWTSFFSFHPEDMQKLNTRFVTFLQGQLYVHPINPAHNNFYGQQYTSQVKLVFNPHPSLVKVYKAISIEANVLWLPIELTTPEGQRSSLQPSDFEKLEDIFYASILCDENTPNVANPVTQGDVMRSAAMSVLLENDNTDQAVLYFVNVESVPSYLSST